MVKGCDCVACRAARLLSMFKVAQGWKKKEAAEYIGVRKHVITQDPIPKEFRKEATG